MSEDAFRRKVLPREESQRESNADGNANQNADVERQTRFRRQQRRLRQVSAFLGAVASVRPVDPEQGHQPTGDEVVGEQSHEPTGEEAHPHVPPERIVYLLDFFHQLWVFDQILRIVCVVSVSDNDRSG